MGCSEASPKREFCSNKYLHHKRGKIPNKQPNITPQGTRKKKEQTKPKVNKRKGIIEITAI